ncbi:FAD-dependent thymidylate synthase [Candidatus Bathyarchaeota archaeon]|nr:FAD-dependent thymidylate synthase [Candidatus Bathyarchaeota archaeon]
MRVELLSYLSTERLLEALKGLGLAYPTPERLLPHVSFTFSVEGISRACSHQLIRHRTASFTQQSQRFVKVKRLREHVVIPESVRERALQPYLEFIDKTGELYVKLLELGVPGEDARFVLPNATTTNLLVTMNGLALRHFFGLRCCLRAQWEIRNLADIMLLKVRSADPMLPTLGPYCHQLGYCPEGRFSCGRMTEVRKRYGELAANF